MCNCFSYIFQINFSNGMNHIINDASVIRHCHQKKYTKLVQKIYEKTTFFAFSTVKRLNLFDVDRGSVAGLK